MLNMKKIRVLVVDDSMVFREILSKGISSDESIEVVAKATDPFDARDKIIQYRPDVMTCDVEMPKMNGIEFIRKLMPQYPIPVVVISSLSDIVFEAMNAGAVDFVAKPGTQALRTVEVFIDEIIAKIKIAASANLSKRRTGVNIFQYKDQNDFLDNRKIVAMGASTGGTEALFSVLKAMPRQMPGIVVTQHIPPVFSRMFAERIDKLTEFEAKEAETGDYVESGKVFIAPGNKHMKIKRLGDRYKIECFEGEKVNGHCPSVDVLFEAVAKEAKNNAVGVILTGMGYDGAKGLLQMKKSGAKTIGQDENSSVVYGMPKVAFDIGAVQKQAPLELIPKLILDMLGR